MSEGRGTMADIEYREIEGRGAGFYGALAFYGLLILLGLWGPCDDCNNCLADLDDDCTVGVKDLLILLGNWG